MHNWKGTNIKKMMDDESLVHVPGNKNHLLEYRVTKFQRKNINSQFIEMVQKYYAS